MVVDEAENDQPKSVAGPATEETLHQVFQEVWFWTYKYTCRYALCFNIDLKELPIPKEEELPPRIESIGESRKHFTQLLKGVMQLTIRLNE